MLKQKEIESWLVQKPILRWVNHTRVIKEEEWMDESEGEGDWEIMDAVDKISQKRVEKLKDQKQ